jgi:uncharacterized SAM-binding protein YcdF (DUF218 family)
VLLELLSLTTHENALFSAALLRRLRAEKTKGEDNPSSSPIRVVVVTCSWHMRRALENFCAAGIDASPLPAGASPASSFRRIFRAGHESVCRWLDDRAMRRSTLIERSLLS